VASHFVVRARFHTSTISCGSAGGSELGGGQQSAARTDANTLFVYPSETGMLKVHTGSNGRSRCHSGSD
jgi:hypothetical protein